MRYLPVLLMTFMFFPVVVMAEHPGSVAESVVHEGARAAFEEFERQTIYKYFRENEYYNGQDAGPGGNRKGKKKDLPPGIQQKLARGGTMPPGIAKQYLPDGLSHRLPPASRGYERLIVGTDVLLVETASGIIADILVDAVLGD